MALANVIAPPPDLSNYGGIKYFSADDAVSIPDWSVYHYAIIIGHMAAVGGFIGYINGTSYTAIAGPSMSGNLSLSMSGTTLNITSSRAFGCTIISDVASFPNS